MPTPQHPHADGSVRVAVPDDAPSIAQIQADALRLNYAALLPDEATSSYDVEAATNGWSEAITHPPSRRHRVFVAVDETAVVGFAASGPAEDADLNPEVDAELLALHVAPDRTRQGHASRLMAAIVDHSRDDHVTRLVMWVFAADDPLRGFLRENGWDADGSTRDLDVGELLHQVRLHTDLSPDPTGEPDLIA